MGFRLFFVFVLVFFAGAAAADTASGGQDSLRWRCWYDQQVHITCLLDTLPEADIPPIPGLPDNLPSLVRRLRNDPGSLGNMTIDIPLLTEPYDMEFTAILATSSVCGSRRDCTVKFTEKVPPAEEIIALIDKHLPQRRSGTTLLAEADIYLDD